MAWCTEGFWRRWRIRRGGGQGIRKGRGGRPWAAGAIAVYTTVPRGTALATVELKINYLEAVPEGRVRAVGRVLWTGRNFAVAECELIDFRGKLAAKALLTFGAAGGHSMGKK